MPKNTVASDDTHGKLTQTGIKVLGAVPWGTHACQFYESKQDLLDILVPYFGAGLENNELCIWVTSAPLGEAEAREAMMGSVPGFGSYVEKGQMQVIPYNEWYLSGGLFEASRVPEMVTSRVMVLSHNGYGGVRMSGNVSWLDRKDWDKFASYEGLVGSLIGGNRITAICSYPLDMCGVRESVEVTSNHDLALIKRHGVWQVVENSAKRGAKATIRKVKGKYRHVFENANVALEVVDAETGRIVLANECTARMFGFASTDDIIGIDPVEHLRLEDRGWVASLMAQVAAGKNWHEIAELRVRRTDGRWFWITGTAVQSEYRGRPAILVSLMDVTSQKEAEQRLRESEEKNRLLVDNAGEGIVVIQDGIPKFVNRRLTELSHYSADEMMSRPFTDSVHSDDRTMVAGYHARRLRGDEAPESCRFRWIDREGATRWAEANAVAITWEGRPAVLAMMNDATERWRAEEALRASEEKFRLLTEKTNDIIWTLDLSLLTTYVSPSIEKVLGFTPEERLAQEPQTQMTPSSFARVQALLCTELAREREQGHSLDTGRAVRVEVEYYHKNGSTVWLENLVSGIRDESGDLIGLHGVSRDITERKMAERALSESERRYRLLAQNVSDVIWVTDMTLRPTYCSPSITRLLGYGVEEAMACPVETMLTSGSFETATHALSKVLSLEEKSPGSVSALGTLQLEFRRKDGSTVWTDTTMSFLRDSSGRPAEVVGVLRDISQRRKAEEHLHHSMKVLEKTVEDTVQAIASTVEMKDSYTAGHQRRVGQLAYAIAQMMHLSTDRCHVIRTAGLLHDLGKISLPTDILTKPGRLSKNEFDLIKTHPQAAYRILKDIESFKEIAEIVLQHHERMNGSGYPLGIRGEQIVPEARILAVSDVVEAMSSHRPYRSAMGLQKAREEISQNSGTLYDPEVVQACLSVFDQTGFRFDEQDGGFGAQTSPV